MIGRRWWPWLAGVPVALLVGLVALVLVLLAGSEQQQCGGDGLPGEFTGPGSLGAVAGTGITAAQVARSVRRAARTPATASHRARYLSTRVRAAVGRHPGRRPGDQRRPA